MSVLHKNTQLKQSNAKSFSFNFVEDFAEVSRIPERCVTQPVTKKNNKKRGTAPPSGGSEDEVSRSSCESCQRQQNLNADVMRGDDTVSSITGLRQCGEKLA